MNNHDPTKRVPKSLGTGTKLFGRYTLTDLAVGLFPGVAVILVTQVLLPQSLSIAGYSLQAFALPFALCGVAVGGLFVYLTPEYTTSIDWIETFLEFYRRDHEHSHDAAAEFTNVERVYPDQNAIERTDGTLLAFIQVMPPTMALATRERWHSQAESFQDFLNTVVEFPIQIYSTTQEFPAEDYLSRYEDRLDDPDVADNPQLAALIENYVSWYRTELEERQMTIRDHYIVVPVTRSEVQFERESLIQKLSALPLVGLFVRAWFAPQQAAQHEAMMTALEERCRRIEAGIREIEGCSADRAASAEAVRLLDEYWSGESAEYGDPEQVLRTRPLIGGRSE
ncbi:hypothetical protein G9464_10455 [Halostella sp. JP-L12]|uniref:hypothetical protein n=1 Tax=Halostella TaxID=1843185 RepID=UPI000EF78AAE|nr:MULTISPECIES: hypothetical protein [Halostella]NHN48017.1 hypothetical protein [Halostella sp. JP-L12]